MSYCVRQDMDASAVYLRVSMCVHCVSTRAFSVLVRKLCAYVFEFCACARGSCVRACVRVRVMCDSRCDSVRLRPHCEGVCIV
jgi:hypothetical protein